MTADQPAGEQAEIIAAPAAARLYWVALLRLAGVAGGAILISIAAGFGAVVALVPLATTLATWAAINLILLVYLRRRGSALAPAGLARLVHAQVIVDLAIITILCHYAGGAENPFFPFFAFPVIFASALLPQRAAYFYAGAASVLYALLLDFERTGWIQHYHLAGLHDPGFYQRVPLLAGQIVALAGVCFMGAIVTSLLVGAVRVRAQALEESNRNAEERAARTRELNEQLLQSAEEGRHAREHLDAAYEELQHAYDRLQIRSGRMSELNEQLRVANAECKARREELVLVNSEVQTAYARLETRTEHMKDLNEQLRVANAECKARREELEVLNAELAVANAKLRELEDVRAQFTLLVTHELRAPVAAIQSYLKLILEGYVPETKVRETIQKAERRAMEQLALIADLLELGRIGSADARGMVKPIQLEQLLLEQVDLLAAAAREREIDVNLEIAPDLPAVLANPEQIKSLWNNLVSNAIKYNKDGGQVTIRLSADAGRVEAMVQDTGIGIPPEAMKRLFSEFFRAENAKAVSRMGTGLGLSIVKEIVERAGGRVTVESVLDAGTTFHFWLPVLAAGLPQSKDPAPETARN